MKKPHIVIATLAIMLSVTMGALAQDTASQTNVSARATKLNNSAPGAVEESPPVFYINPGLNDAWYDPSTSGQGFLLTVYPDAQLIFVAWFTFDTERPPENVEALLGDPGHRWFTAIGAFEPGNPKVNLEIELTEGMIFDSAEPTYQQTPGYGSLSLEWHDCENAMAVYDFPAQSLGGEIALVRVASDEINLSLCTQLNEEQSNG